MKRLETAIQFDAWARRAHPGDRAVYHEGLIAADRQGATRSARRVDRLADHAHQLGEVNRVVMRKCGHVKETIAAQRKCRLLQQRVEEGCWLYIAERI